MTNTPVRVRLAPSPTGHLHVGTARTALFNELFARKNQGAFILRIEDTDKVRSNPAFEQSQIEALKWLGITWDEGPDVGGPFGPYRQSQRLASHQEAITALINSGHAYIDTENNNVVKLRVESQQVTFTDLVRGTVTIASDSWGGDFVIARSTTDPLFHLTVVVDDAAQNITHVIRGEDHLSNTARHIVLQKALGITTPQYAHLPLLLDEHRHKLSKRAAETNVLAYRDLGYLPQAILNYLTLLGWNPKTDQEYFTREELIATFSLEGIQKGGAIFSITKLQAMNKHFIRALTPSQLLAASEPFLTAAGINHEDTNYWQAALVTEQERVATLAELPEAVAFYVPNWQPMYKPALLVWKKSTPETTKLLLEKLRDFIQQLSDTDFTPPVLQEKVMAWLDESKLDRGEVLWPMRVALTGLANSPGPFEVASVLGKAATTARIEMALKKVM